MPASHFCAKPRRVALLLLCLLACRAAGARDLDERCDRALHFARAQALKALAEMGDTLAYPRSTTAEGRWRLVPATDWTSGFFPGLLWYLYEDSGDGVLLDAARRWTEGLESQRNNPTTHDLGFMLFSSYGNGYRLLGEESYRQTLLIAARTLASRFNPRVGCIKSWDWSQEWECPVIIDNLMNLELLFWAARNGGGERLRAIAVAHAERTLENHLRADGSTVHVVNYDSTNGRVIARLTHQGLSASSTWARGQAWALYGFAVCFRETRDARFLEASVRAARYFVDHLPADGVPYWDFLAADLPDTQKDASAAAIAASGLLELSQLAGEAGGAAYRSAAEHILTTLSGPPYLDERSSTDGILNHCVADRTRDIEVDVSLIYADYYFVEAMLRWRRIAGGR